MRKVFGYGTQTICSFTLIEKRKKLITKENNEALSRTFISWVDKEQSTISKMCRIVFSSCPIKKYNCFCIIWWIKISIFLFQVIIHFYPSILVIRKVGSQCLKIVIIIMKKRQRIVNIIMKKPKINKMTTTKIMKTTILFIMIGLQPNHHQGLLNLIGCIFTALKCAFSWIKKSDVENF